MLTELKIDLTEAEYAQLLLACSVGGAPWPRVESVLHRISRELTSLQVSEPSDEVRIPPET